MLCSEVKKEECYCQESGREFWRSLEVAAAIAWTNAPFLPVVCSRGRAEVAHHLLSSVAAAVVAWKNAPLCLVPPLQPWSRGGRAPPPDSCRGRVEERTTFGHQPPPSWLRENRAPPQDFRRRLSRECVIQEPFICIIFVDWRRAAKNLVLSRD